MLPRTMVKLQLPRKLDLVDGGLAWVERGAIDVLPAGKVKRPRFEPGAFIRYQRQLYEIRYIYRLRHDPQWRYLCDYRTDVVPEEPANELAAGIMALEADRDTKLMVPEIFLREQDVRDYFVNLYLAADGRTFTNQQLAQGARLVSSGSVLPGS
jgi:hypothetical protein